MVSSFQSSQTLKFKRPYVEEKVTSPLFLACILKPSAPTHHPLCSLFSQLQNPTFSINPQELLKTEKHIILVAKNFPEAKKTLPGSVGHSLIHHVTSALQGLQFSCQEWKMYYCSDPFAQSLAEEELKSHWLTTMLNTEWHMPYRVLCTELYVWLIFWRIHRTVILEKVCKGWIAHLSEQGGSETICISIRLSQALSYTNPTRYSQHSEVNFIVAKPTFLLRKLRIICSNEPPQLERFQENRVWGKLWYQTAVRCFVGLFVSNVYLAVSGVDTASMIFVVMCGIFPPIARASLVVACGLWSVRTQQLRHLGLAASQYAGS